MKARDQRREASRADPKCYPRRRRARKSKKSICECVSYSAPVAARKFLLRALTRGAFAISVAFLRSRRCFLRCRALRRDRVKNWRSYSIRTSSRVAPYGATRRRSKIKPAGSYSAINGLDAC